MTAIPQPSFSLVTETPDRRTLVVRVTGAIDHESYDALVNAVERQLLRHPGLRELRLDCAGLHGVDALGLSGILMVQRLTEGAGARLRLQDPDLGAVLEPQQGPGRGAVEGEGDAAAGDIAGDRRGGGAAAAFGLFGEKEVAQGRGRLRRLLAQSRFGLRECGARAGRQHHR